MGANFQDVIRDVHDPSLHALKTTASLSASTVYVGNPTLYAVVNTGAAGDSTANIGFATVAISNPTLFAVVNTSAPGVGNSIVTVANPNFGINAGVNNIGFATVTNVNQPALVASNANIGSVSVLGGTLNTITAVTDITNPIALKGNVTLSDSKGFIGLTTTVIASTPTIFAVVNTGAAGIQNSMVTINPRTDYFGLVSVSGNVAVSSLPATPAGANFIGLVTVANTVPVTGTFWQATQPVSGTVAVTQSGTWDEVGINDSGNSITIDGTVTANLAAGVTNIGFASVTPVAAWPDPKTYIGLVTVANTVTVAAHALTASTVNIGSVSVLGGTIGVSSLPALVASTVNIGSVSVLGGGIGLNAGINGIGFVTVANAAGTQFIGLVTAISRNAGTTKTLIPFPVGLGQNSIATIAVPTNSNKINLTQLILNSNVTTEIAIKSGVTYLTGNASLGITLFPGGGFVMNGAPDSPAWIGLPSGAMVVEKRDGVGTVSKIGGSVIYFDE